jgi:hypothetical protein
MEKEEIIAKVKRFQKNNSIKNQNVKITFDEVTEFLVRQHQYLNYQDIKKIMNSVEPFVMDYITCPVGYAETDNLNDINQLVNEIKEAYYGIEFEPDGRKRNRLVNDIIKTETTRWSEGRNAGFYGRHIGRLAYLLNNKK